jgi:hypothetical protein
MRMSLITSRPYPLLTAPLFVGGLTTTGCVDTRLIPLAQDRGIAQATTGPAFDATGSYDVVAAAIVLAAASAICLALRRPRPTLAPASASPPASPTA